MFHLGQKIRKIAESHALDNSEREGWPSSRQSYFNPFHATGLFRYPLKTSENPG